MRAGTPHGNFMFVSRKGKGLLVPVNGSHDD